MKLVVLAFTSATLSKVGKLKHNTLYENLIIFDIFIRYKIRYYQKNINRNNVWLI